MKYIDIQLTDKELWAQFQAKYQAGEYADALALLQTPNPNSEVFVWEKYDILYAYKITEKSSTDFEVNIPSDADTSVRYQGYTFDAETGTFTMTGADYTGMPCYYPSSYPNKIYKYKFNNSEVVPSTYTTTTMEAVQDNTTTPKKGDTYYGTVTSEDEAAYPADGEQDGYWYVLVGKTAVGGYSGYKGLIAEALNTLTNYIVQVENLNDSTFKADKPPVQANQPTQTTGQLWFQVTN